MDDELVGVTDLDIYHMDPSTFSGSIWGIIDKQGVEPGTQK